jgi:SAM-dependent methyltransferase
MRTIPIGGSLSLSFLPTTPGNWVFHCHFAGHVGEIVSLHDSPGAFIAASDHGDHAIPAHDMPGGHTMRGLVIGMHVTPAGLGGDVVCAADALPWEDDAFQLVVAQHAGDALARPDELIEQLTRVLAPGGALLWFGLNPLSPWILWLHWRAREGLPLPRAMHAESLRRRLHGKLTPGAAEAIGACWPNRAPAAKRAALLAPLRGAWMLVASKQRAVLTPLQRRPLRSRVTPQPSLAVPNRRVRA